MPKHRRATRPVSEQQARRRTAAGLIGAGALTATLLTALGTPAAPPAPDRQPTAPTLDTARSTDN
ncbi:hypothetical protein ACIRTB_23020 [Streptomyces sp. NPDC101158]|uniref:hypothetical protein n=1 Tax=Streptomyces sp. NPDC101158 TaxID=3366117 RepID=UPI00381098EF